MLTLESDVEQICCAKMGYSFNDGKIIFAPTTQKKPTRICWTDIIKNFLTDNGPATASTIGKESGVPTSTVWSCLGSLVKSGYVNRHKPVDGGAYVFSIAEAKQKGD